MTFTYDPEDLSSVISQVRLMIQDTDSDHPFLSDEEIQHYLDQTGDIYAAASEACLAIAAKFARRMDRTGIGISDAPQRVSEYYLRLAQQLAGKGGASLSIFAGGRTVSGKKALASDPDKIQPSFRVGMDDNHRPQDSSDGDFDGNE